MRCWLCGIDVDHTNTSGARSQKLKNECIGCHNIYTIFLQLEKKDPVEVNARLGSLLRTVKMYKLLLNNPGMKAKDLSKLYLRS